MWANINALYAAVCKLGVTRKPQVLEEMVLRKCYFSFLLFPVIFAGSVVAASIPEIQVTDQFPTNVSSVTRWINMYLPGKNSII